MTELNADETMAMAEPVDGPDVSDEVKSKIASVSDAVNARLIAVLRQVIKGQLAMADSEQAIADMRAALAEARHNAKAGRRNLQLTLIDLIDAEMAEQLNDWRALVGAEDAEDRVRLRIEQLRAAMIRHSISLGRMQEAQSRVLNETFDPVIAVLRQWRQSD